MQGERAHRLEAPAMNRAGSQSAQRGEMLGGGVAEIAFETVSRVLDGEFDHQAIALVFCENACGGDGGIGGIALDDRTAQNGRLVGHMIAVNERAAITRGEPFERALHAPKRSAEDVTAIDFFGGHVDDVERSSLTNLDFEAFALLAGELLAILQAGDWRIFGEQHCRDDHRASEWASSGFVHAGKTRAFL